MSSQFRGRKSYPRRIHLLLLLLLLVLSAVLLLSVFHNPPGRDGDAIPHISAFRLVDALLDEALHVSLSFSAQNHQDGRPSASLGGADSDTYLSPLASSLDALRAQLCQILHGRSIFLVGPHETLYQLHLFILAVLHPDLVPGSTMALTAHASCPARPTLSSSCPSHPLCHPIIKLPPPSRSDSSPGFGPDTGYGYGYEPLRPADIPSTNSSSSSTSSLLRFFHSGNLNPSTTQEDARPSVPSVDPRTGVRVVDSRWVRYAASSKASILVLNRGPLPAPGWSYNNNPSSARNLTWLTTLRALEQEHAEPLSDLFADVLSRLDDHDHDHHLPSESDTKKLAISAALHSTISTFLPSLLSTLSKLREHAGHRAILGGKKPVLWYGSWFLPVSCTPDSLSVFSSPSSESDPRRLLVRLLAQAEVMDNPWSAYYNAQGLYYDKMCALLASPC
jgi:hypothetical protein